MGITVNQLGVRKVSAGLQPEIRLCIKYFTATTATASCNGQTINMTYESTLSAWTCSASLDTWTVTATDGTTTRTESITISSVQQYVITWSLPEGYTELEYIQGTNGTSTSIDTQYKAIRTNRIEGKFQLATTGTNTSYSMNLYVGHNYHYLSKCNQNAWRYSCASSSDIYTTFGTADTLMHEFNSRQTNIVFDETTFSVATSNLTSNTYNMNVCFSSSSTGRPICRWFYFKIYNTGDTKLDADLVPAKRTSDNALGMYDRIRSAFYTASGSPIAGPAV